MAISIAIILSFLSLVLGGVAGFLIRLTEENYLKVVFTITSLSVAFRFVLPFLVNNLNLKDYVVYVSIPETSPVYMLIGGALLVICLRGFKFFEPSQ